MVENPDFDIQAKVDRIQFHGKVRKASQLNGIFLYVCLPVEMSDFNEQIQIN